jgi:type II secretory pathway component PulK
MRTAIPSLPVSRLHGVRPSSRRGIVLPAVLVVVVLLTLAAYEFSELMTAEYRAAESNRRAVQAHALADSGIHYAAALLSNTDTFTNTLNSNPFNNPQMFQGIIVQPSDKPYLQGRFSIVAPPPLGGTSGTSQPVVFGAVDESGKVNINALIQLDSSGQIAYNVLMSLPNMTDDVANSIIDWIDPDSDPRTDGAEDEYYSSQNPPYHTKNGPLDSLEELLLVKGVTPQLLFGNDLNRNGILDPGEDDGTGVVNQGLSQYLTVYSRELNVDSQGNPRIYINSQDLDTLYGQLNTALGQELANYILAYRLYGPYTPSANGASSANSSGAAPSSGTTGSGASSNNNGGAKGSPTGGASSGGGASSAGAGSGAGMSSRTGSGGAASGGAASSAGAAGTSSSNASANTPLSRSMLNFNQGRPRAISSLYQLVNSSVAMPGGSSTSVNTNVAVSPNGRNAVATTTVATTTATIIYPSPLNDPSKLSQLLPLLLDETSTTQNQELPARINVNTASATVLAGLPGLTPADVQGIVDNQPNYTSGTAPDPMYQTPAWLISLANLSPSKLQALEPYITARSQVYRVQAVGAFDSGGPTARIEAVIDMNHGRPRIVSYRDLTELGKGFDMSLLKP